MVPWKWSGNRYLCTMPGAGLWYVQYYNNHTIKIITQSTLPHLISVSKSLHTCPDLDWRGGGYGLYIMTILCITSILGFVHCIPNTPHIRGWVAYSKKDNSIIHKCSSSRYMQSYIPWIKKACMDRKRKKIIFRK